LQEIMLWFHRLKGKSKGGQLKPFEPFLKMLCKVGRSPASIVPFKFYMSHPDFRAKCFKEYESRWKDAGLNARLRVDFQCRVAAELYDKEPDDIKAKIKAEIVKEHEERLTAYKQLMNSDKFVLDTSKHDFGDIPRDV
jgi:hypothetical protein